MELWDGTQDNIVPAEAHPPATTLSGQLMKHFELYAMVSCWTMRQLECLGHKLETLQARRAELVARVLNCESGMHIALQAGWRLLYAAPCSWGIVRNVCIHLLEPCDHKCVLLCAYIFSVHTRQVGRAGEQRNFTVTAAITVCCCRGKGRTESGCRWNSTRAACD